MGNPDTMPFKSLLSEIAISIVSSLLWYLNQEFAANHVRFINNQTWIRDSIHYPLYKALFKASDKRIFNALFTEYRWRIVPEVIEHYNSYASYLTLGRVQKIKKLQKYHNPQFCYDIIRTYFNCIGNVNLVVSKIDDDLLYHLSDVYLTNKPKWLPDTRSELMWKRFILIDITRDKCISQLFGMKGTFSEVKPKITIF